MSRYIAQHDGLFLGSSSAVNLVASVRLAKSRGWKGGEKIVTILCDSGSRHFSKVSILDSLDDPANLFSVLVGFCRRLTSRSLMKYFRNDEYLRKAGLRIETSIIEDLLSS